MRAVVTKPVSLDGNVVVPNRALLTGWVRRAISVGMGLRRERALLDVEFDSLELPGGERFALKARVHDLDNARESVNKDGVILGTRVTATMQGTATSRLWHLPTLNPYPHPVLWIHKALFPYFPDPEIRLPRGTDLRVRLTMPPSLPSGGDRPDEMQRKPLPEHYTHLPPRVQTRDGKQADVMNMVIIGDREEVRRAFDAAGWSETRAYTTKSVLRGMRDVLKIGSDPNAPMSRMYWNGHSPELKFQKSLNTYAKRHHVRVWSADETHEGKTVWFAAATHDTGVKFAWKRMWFTHGTSPEVDLERQKIVDDLVFPGCVAGGELWDREFLPMRLKNSDGGAIVTDGAMAVLELKPCEHSRIGSEREMQELAKPDKTFVKRYLQRQLLVVRHDFLRSNVVYGIWDLTRYLVRSYSNHRLYARTYKKAPYNVTKARVAATIR